MFGVTFILIVLLGSDSQPVEAITECLSLDNAQNERFEILYDWKYLNYTWPGRGEVYSKAVREKRYAPEAAALAGVKYHADKLYLSIPRSNSSSPVTLAWVPQTPLGYSSSEALLAPYPSWEMNRLGDCRALQNVHGFEIDRKGILWALDARRLDGTTTCPPRIVLLDLNRAGRIVADHRVPTEVCRASSCFLNDIVVDEIDGGWAYITDTDENDPGLVVYSRQQGRSWKVRDSSAMAEYAILGFSALGVTHTSPTPIDGIALSPQNCLDDPKRTIYYTALVGLSMWAIDSDILRQAAMNSQGIFPRLVGPKLGPSDGMVVDSVGNLIYSVVTQNAVAKWHTSHGSMNETNQQIFDRNDQLLIWPDTFGFDTFGTVYLTATDMDRFMQRGISIDQTNFRILRLYTATCSYQF